MSEMYQELLKIVNDLRKDATTTGITTGTGLNFFYLEPQAKNLYPVLYPALQTIPRVYNELNGVRVGGLGVNWKAITSIDTDGYPMISEGNRNAFMNRTEKDYFAPWGYIGKDDFVNFQAQSTSQGFDDALSISQTALLNALLNDEERAVFFGNDGSAARGFQLGTANTPTATAATTGGALASGLSISARIVALTAWGNYLSTATGVKLPKARLSANGATDTINGGTSAISAASNIVTTGGSGAASVSFTWTPSVGAVAYAVYIDSVDATTNQTQNCVFSAVSPFSKFTLTALPASTNQLGNAAGLNSDASFNTLDFCGLLTTNINYSTATPSPSYYKDLQGANLTATGDGTIVEFEAALDQFWLQYKIQPDKIWLGGNMINPVSKKILGAGVSNAPARMIFQSNEGGTLTGGIMVRDYRSKYGANGRAIKTIPIETHPWLPQGMVFMETINNPYPAAGDAIPTVRQIVTLEDHFGIKWPYVTLQHQHGVYAFMTIKNYVPYASVLLVGCNSN